MKDVIDVILYKVKTGCHWHLLPNDFPPYKTVFDYFRHWTLEGTLVKLHNEMRILVRKKMKNEQTSIAIINNQSVKLSNRIEIKAYD